MSSLAKSRTVPMATPAGRILPLAALWTLAAIYAGVALGACLLPAGPGLRNSAGSVVGNDFLTFYAASLLVHAGQAAAVFDSSRFYAVQEAISGLKQHFQWAYPPIFLLMVAPLAGLPYLAALAAWLATASLAFGLVVRRLSGLALPLVLVAPPLIQNAADGQNGALTAALIAGGILALSRRRSIIAGCLFGLLAYKPQVFVLAPVCLLAARDWRALLALVLTSCGLALASLTCFGIDIWWQFLVHLHEHAMGMMANLGPSDRVPTVFALIYKLTLNARMADFAQAIATLGAWALVYWVWRNTTDVFTRALAFCIAMPLSTPIMLEYDLAIWTLPVAMLTVRLWRNRGTWADWLALAVLMFLPSLIWAVSSAGLNVWALAIIAFIPYVVFAMRRANNEGAQAV